MQMRLDKLVSSYELEGRGEAKTLIKSGQVTVNGEVCKRPEQKVDSDVDRVFAKGIEIKYRQFTTVMLNKPAGVLSATEDKHDPTAADLLTGKYAKMELKPAGRLDKDATGLLLLTNDGELNHYIISPSKSIWKYYEVTLSSPLMPDAGERVASGIVLTDGNKCLPARLEYEPGTMSARISLHEGKFHQVKRMIAALGSHVVTLKRVKIGPLSLDPELKEGDFRELTDTELRSLRDACGL